MAFMRNNGWENDKDLKDDLEKHVRQGLRRKEVLDFMERDYSQYPWSLRSLDRRMRYFDIYYTDKDVTVDQVIDAVEKEVSGPGRLLGYRAMHMKLRQQHELKVPHDLVHAVMQEVDPEGLQERCVGTGKKKRKGTYSTMGTNWVHSLDGHDKLMGYQSSTYPLAVYGCLDSASRKILWLHIWVSNSDPNLIGYWYLQHIFKTKKIASYLRLDKGTETGTMATIHAFLRQYSYDGDPCDTILYGPSTSNQVS